MLACESTFDPEQATLETFTGLMQASATAGSIQETESGVREATTQAEATNVGEQMVATQAAQRAVGGAEQAATAQAFQPFLAELGRYGVDPTLGRPGWALPPVTLEAEGYLKYDFGQQALSTVAQDFLVSVDITWDTQSPQSGCGLALRSNGIVEAPSQYIIIATREAIGHVLVNSMLDGRIINSYDLYTYGFDPAYNIENNATNRLVIVMVANQISVYTNGNFLGSVAIDQGPPLPRLPEPPVRPAEPASPEALAAFEAETERFNRFIARILADNRTRQLEFEPPATTLERGLIALSALNETGFTRCTFNNAWLWLIE